MLATTIHKPRKMVFELGIGTARYTIFVFAAHYAQFMHRLCTDYAPAWITETNYAHIMHAGNW